eukprot:gene15820-biopygen10555
MGRRATNRNLPWEDRSVPPALCSAGLQWPLQGCSGAVATAGLQWPLQGCRGHCRAAEGCSGAAVELQWSCSGAAVATAALQWPRPIDSHHWSY